MRSALPADTSWPSVDQAQRSRIFSKLWTWPVNTLTQRFCGANGRMSHTRSVLSIAFDSRWLPSGLTLRPVMVSLCPCSTRLGSASLRRSHTLMVLSRPPLYTWSPASAKATDVTWNLSENVRMLRFTRMSHTFTDASSDADAKSGGPRRMGHTLFTWLSCSVSFLTWVPVTASHARTVLSAEQDTSFSPSVNHCTSRIAFRWPLSIA
mmetsp:Transcript_6200/g.13515  ORF Transcript_6200/g.13515 Transcript_6200/m.13515 type:complete len:208 (-) Transcript_6200:519-1142(-)